MISLNQQNAPSGIDKKWCMQESNNFMKLINTYDFFGYEADFCREQQHNRPLNLTLPY